MLNEFKVCSSYELWLLYVLSRRDFPSSNNASAKIETMCVLNGYISILKPIPLILYTGAHYRLNVLTAGQIAGWVRMEFLWPH